MNRERKKNKIIDEKETEIEREREREIDKITDNKRRIH